jgi:hypothetical protein
MLAFNIDWRTRAGTDDAYRDIVLRAPLARPPHELMVLARELKTSPPVPSPLSPGTLIERWQAGQLKACLSIEIDPSSLILKPEAVVAGVWHYVRLADATLKPLADQPGMIGFAPGDAYIALSPGACRVADSPTVARFLHLRDDFNAEKLAGTLLDHLVEIAGVNEPPEDLTALVVEVR